jgi:hypothetical protein
MHSTEPLHAKVEWVFFYHCTAYMQRTQGHTLRRETELRSEYSRSQVGIKIARLCPRCVALPEGTLHFPGQKKCLFAPYCSTPSRNLGATKIRDTCLHPFLHLRERFETLAVLLKFSPFWAGKFHGITQTKRGRCAIVHLCHDVSPTKEKQKGWAHK